MKKIFLRITTIVMALFACLLVFASCGNTNITDELIRTKLSNSEGELAGTLTVTNGTLDNVLAFDYVVTEISANKLMDKTYTKNAVRKMLSDPGSVTYRELEVCNAVLATMSVVSIFSENENFEDNDFNEVLSIICDRESKTYENWTISASVNQKNDSITIKAIHD